MERTQSEIKAAGEEEGGSNFNTLFVYQALSSVLYIHE